MVEQRTENPRVGGSIPPLGTIFLFLPGARVAELADARDLKSRGRKAVRVRFPPRAPTVKLPFGRLKVSNIENAKKKNYEH